MEMLDEKYMDMISGEFAYDPVRLPVEQDPTQALYNRKTLESIWETKHQALNPYTRQWFDIKSAIPQRELRREMEHYIELHKIPSDVGELDIIAEYILILDMDTMKQHLKMVDDYISEKVMTEKQYWVTIWKKINLLRLYCQFHDANIQTFRFVHGFRYFEKLISQMSQRHSAAIPIRKLGVMDVCKELTRLIDVIGLRLSDMVPQRSNMGDRPSKGLINMLRYTYYNSGGFLKIQSIVLRVLSKTFDQMALISNMGSLVCHHLAITGLIVASLQLSRVHAKDISSEDLNHGIGILRASSLLTLEITYIDKYLQILGDALIICIAREIPQRSHEISGFIEGQVLEIHAQAQHNADALEKGLWVIHDMLMEGGPLAQTFQDSRGSSLVTEIGGMFKRFTEVQHEDKDGHVICPKGCTTFECVHIRIAQHGLGISAAISRGVHKFDSEVMQEFLRTSRERAALAAEFKISPSSTT